MNENILSSHADSSNSERKIDYPAVPERVHGLHRETRTVGIGEFSVLQTVHQKFRGEPCRDLDLTPGHRKRQYTVSDFGATVDLPTRRLRRTRPAQ